MTAPPLPLVCANLRVAADDAQRDAVIAAWLENRPSGGADDRLLVLADGLLFDRPGPQGIAVRALAGGCPCCAGKVALRVALTRALRSVRPAALLLLVTDSRHLERLRDLLTNGELGLAFSVED